MENPNEDNNMDTSEGDQASSGQSPTDSQDFDHRTDKESSHENIPVNGAPDGDETKPSEEKRMILDSNVDSQQAASYSGQPIPPSESHRVPDLDQLPVSASLKDFISINISTMFHSMEREAAECIFSKEQKETLDSSVDLQQVASYSRRPDHPAEIDRVPDSDQLPVFASFKFSKEQKETLDFSVDLQQVASYSRRPDHPAETDRVPDSDQLPVQAYFKFSKEQKETLDSSVDLQQVASYSRTPDHPAEIERVPDSDQLPVPPSFQELMLLKVPSDLHNAAVTLGRYHPYRDNDRNVKKFFKALGKAIKEPDSAESSKSSSSHAGTVKVHKIVRGKTFGADEALLKQLNCEELQVKMTDRQGCDIIILFCPINSRVGSDVEFAMRQVSGEERVILILMHHTRDVDYSTAAKRWSETFDNVVFDINVLYHETVPGLLTCPKNTEAISDIRKELMPYSSSTSGNMFTRFFSVFGSTGGV